MAFAKGNKHAVGSQVNGRPRIYDYEKEAAELLEYAKKDDSLTIERFTSNKNYLVQDLTDFAQRCPVFALSLKKAKELIGNRREELAMLNKINFGVYNRTARMYSKPLRNEEEETKDEELQRKMKLLEFEYKLKKESGLTVAGDLLEKFDKYMQQIDQAQESSSKSTEIVFEINKT